MILLKQEIVRYISTNLEQPYAVWNENDTYQAKTSVVHNNHIFRSIVDNNRGTNPDLNTGKWLRFQVDNAFASIDLRSHTITVMDEGLNYIEFVFDAQNFNYLAFSQIQGSSLEIWEYDYQGNELTHNLMPIGETRICADNWYNYYFCAVPLKASLGVGKPMDMFLDKLQGNTTKIKIRIHKNVNNVATVGVMAGGAGVSIGDTQYGVTQELVDFTERTVDKEGIIDLEKHDALERMEVNILMSAKNAQRVKREVKEHLGLPILFIADESTDSLFENLILFGYIQKYEQYLNNGVIAQANMRIEELI